MRHKVRNRRLGRIMGGRKALMRNLAKQMIMHGRIVTTVTRAKELRGVVEPLITRAKGGTVNDRRIAAMLIDDRDLLKKLFDELGPHFKDRNGGDARILKRENRKGDNALTAIMEFVDREKVYKKEEKKDAKAEKKAPEKPKKEEKKKEEKKKEDKKKEDKKEEKKAKK